jgi:hypothetical protein
MAMTKKDFIIVAEALTHNPIVYDGSEEGKAFVKEMMSMLKAKNPRFCEVKFQNYLFFNRKVA